MGNFINQLIDNISSQTIQLVDLTQPIESCPSEVTGIEIDTLDHVSALKELGLTEDDFPDGYAISNERITLTTHSGCHIDAPLHYGPETHGVPAQSIDEAPIGNFFGRAVCLDVTGASRYLGITQTDIENELERQNCSLSDVNIVLLKTGASEKWGTREYFTDFSGLSYEGCKYLLDHGVKVIGIDAWGLDQPAPLMIQSYKETGDKNALWPVHVLGRTMPYYQIEKLSNLDALPANGEAFVVACMPIPVKGAGAGWTRAVALVDAK